MKRNALQLGCLLVFAMAATACATTHRPTPSVTVVRVDGDHLRIRSAYLRAGSDLAVVRGTVSADPLWRGPIPGGLQVIAFDAAGVQIASRSARWSAMAPGGRVRTATYTAPLGIPTTQVARIVVRHVAKPSPPERRRAKPATVSNFPGW